MLLVLATSGAACVRRRTRSARSPASRVGSGGRESAGPGLRRRVFAGRRECGWHRRLATAAYGRELNAFFARRRCSVAVVA
jgi:hypothetical protein